MSAIVKSEKSLKKVDEKKPEQQYIVRTMLEWHAPNRPFKKRTSMYFRSSILIAVLIEIILFLFSQYMLMLVVASFLFLSVAMASVSPHESHYKISTEGFMVDEHFFLWQELYDFYFKKTYDQDVMHLRTEALIPGEILIPLDTKVTKELLKTIMARFLPYREVVRQTFMEKSGDWLSRNFPLENPTLEKPQAKVAS